MHDYTRRRFLEDSMFAAAAAVAAKSATTAHAAEASPSTSPNEKLNVALVGVGGRGRDHLKSFASRAETEVVYICDVDSRIGESQVEAAAKLQDGRRPKYVQDIREVCDDPSVDIVSIATPNHWHALAAIWALQKGKDVYVEKPVSHNVSEGRRIVEAARKYQRICQTGTQSRSNSGMQKAIEFLRSGQIGEIKLARGLCYKPRGSIGPKGDYKVPASVNYDLWLGPAPTAPLTRRSLHYDWHWMWDYGNGDLGNQGIHQMDICRWGLGVADLGRNVLSYGGRVGYTDAGETANTQVCIHDYGDKRIVFEVRGLRTEPLRGADVGVIFYGGDDQGSGGYVVMTSYAAGAAFDAQGNKIAEFSGGGDHYGNFLSAVRSRKSEDLAADILQGHLSSALCHLGNISYRLGTPVVAPELKERLGEDAEAQETLIRFQEHLGHNDLKLEETSLTFGRSLAVNGEAETFANDADANRHLTREYRTPFVVPAAGEV